MHAATLRYAQTAAVETSTAGAYKSIIKKYYDRGPQVAHSG